jgi:hypothetical protein
MQEDLHASVAKGVFSRHDDMCLQATIGSNVTCVTFGSTTSMASSNSPHEVTFIEIWHTRARTKYLFMSYSS